MRFVGWDMIDISPANIFGKMLQFERQRANKDVSGRYIHD